MKRSGRRALFLAVLLAALAFTGCAEEEAPVLEAKVASLPAEVERAEVAPVRLMLTEVSGETDAWQALAETFLRRTGLAVTITTAPEESYSVSLQEEMARESMPTIFLLSGTNDADAWDDYTETLSLTALSDHVRYSSEYLYLAGKTAGLPDGNGYYFALNQRATDADLDASTRFLSWVIGTPEGRAKLPGRGLTKLYR